MTPDSRSIQMRAMKPARTHNHAHAPCWLFPVRMASSANAPTGMTKTATSAATVRIAVDVSTGGVR